MADCEKKERKYTDQWESKDCRCSFRIDQSEERIQKVCPIRNKYSFIDLHVQFSLNFAWTILANVYIYHFLSGLILY